MTDLSLETLVRKIREAGSSHEGFFRYPVREDGLYLQQDPEEFAAFVHFMATEVGEADVTLDIGIASGGQTKFLRDHFRARQTLIVDNGEHEMFPHWARIKPMVQSEIVLEMISDSHAPAVREALAPWRGKVDFAFVDGDHSYRGLRQDIFLVTPLLREGAIMALHDTAAVWDCKRVFDDLLRSPSFTLLRNFDNRFGISLWQRLGRDKPQKWWNAHGYGRL
jgi:hypothetical protein